MKGFDYLLENIDSIIEINDLNDAMFKLQGILGIEDGTVCGIYWADFDNAEYEWKNAGGTERILHIQNYLNLEVKLNFMAMLNNR